MNRLAFSTLPCEGWTLDEMIGIAGRCGFAGMELREGGLWGVHVEMTPEERFKALRKFRESGIVATDIASGVCLTGADGDRAQLEHFRKVASLAADLHAAGVRIFLGYFNDRRDRAMPPIPYEALANGVKEACDAAAEDGVEVWVETHNEFATGRSLRSLLDDVGRPNCKVIYDIIHPLEEGESPEETVALLGADCVHVHIKDGVPFEDPAAISWKYTHVGEGAVPIADIVRRLERSGYSGRYSLEWETKWRKELQVPGAEPTAVFPAYVAYMRELFQSVVKGNAS
jgi:sugar phosphate isomerase/epimerase